MFISWGVIPLASPLLRMVPMTTRYCLVRSASTRYSPWTQLSTMFTSLLSTNLTRLTGVSVRPIKRKSLVRPLNASLRKYVRLSSHLLPISSLNPTIQLGRKTPRTLTPLRAPTVRWSLTLRRSSTSGPRKSNKLLRKPIRRRKKTKKPAPAKSLNTGNKECENWLAFQSNSAQRTAALSTTFLSMLPNLPLTLPIVLVIRSILPLASGDLSNSESPRL